MKTLAQMTLDEMLTIRRQYNDAIDDGDTTLSFLDYHRLESSQQKMRDEIDRKENRVRCTNGETLIIDADGILRDEYQGLPAFKPTSDDAIAFAGTVVMLLAMLGLIAILQ